MSKYNIAEQKFGSISEVEAWLKADELNRLSTPELILWEVLNQIPWNELQPEETSFVTSVGLGIITTWKEESHTNPNMRRFLLGIGEAIEGIQKK